MDATCKIISIAGKSDEFIKLLIAEENFWREHLAQNRYDGTVADALCRRHIIKMLLEAKEANLQETKCSLLESVGFAWRQEIPKKFDKNWADIAGYQNKEVGELQSQIPHLNR
jgi:hypothetical protein